MRRGLLIALLAAALVTPAAASAATPQPTISVSNVHWVSRGVIGVDVTWTCVAPPKGAEWDPGLYVVLQQGRRGASPWGLAELGLWRSACDGARHTRSLTVQSESRPFHGSRVVAWAGIEASWYIASSDRYVPQWAEVDLGAVRIGRR